MLLPILVLFEMILEIYKLILDSSQLFLVIFLGVPKQVSIWACKYHALLL